jgi:predicted nucleotidyltransferase
MGADVIRTAPQCWLTPRPLEASSDLGPGLDPVALEAGVKRLAARADVQALVVFGSRASDRARPDSDLDLLVISREPSISPERQLPLWQELRTALGDVGMPVDLLVYGQREAAKLGGSRWHVLGHAARSGRVLYVAA